MGYDAKNYSRRAHDAYRNWTMKSTYEERLHERTEPDPHSPGPRSLVELNLFLGDNAMPREAADPPLTEDEVAYLDNTERELKQLKARGTEATLEIPFD